MINSIKKVLKKHKYSQWNLTEGISGTDLRFSATLQGSDSAVLPLFLEAGLGSSHWACRWDPVMRRQPAPSVSVSPSLALRTASGPACWVGGRSHAGVEQPHCGRWEGQGPGHQTHPRDTVTVVRNSLNRPAFPPYTKLTLDQSAIGVTRQKLISHHRPTSAEITRSVLYVKLNNVDFTATDYFLFTHTVMSRQITKLRAVNIMTKMCIFQNMCGHWGNLITSIWLHREGHTVFPWIHADISSHVLGWTHISSQESPTSDFKQTLLNPAGIFVLCHFQCRTFYWSSTIWTTESNSTYENRSDHFLRIDLLPFSVWTFLN